MDKSKFACFQTFESSLPKNFNFVFTHFLIIESCGIYQKHFNFSKLLFCGTKSGAIVVLGLKKDNDTFEYLNLLIGHYFEITCFLFIQETLHVISISKDATVSVWSVLDGLCIISQKIKKMNLGNYQMICSSEYKNHLWVWDPGIGAFLYNISSNTIIKRIDFYGLKSLNIINNSFKQPYCVFVGINNYQLLNEKSLKCENNIVSGKNDEINPEDFLAVLSCGILIVHPNGRWLLINPFTGLSLIDSFLPDMEKEDNDNEYDRICHVVQYNEYSFCIGTLSGKFYIIELAEKFKHKSIPMPDLSHSSSDLNDFDGIPLKISSIKVIRISSLIKTNSMEYLNAFGSSNIFYINNGIFTFKSNTGIVFSTDGHKIIRIIVNLSHHKFKLMHHSASFDSSTAKLKNLYDDNATISSYHLQLLPPCSNNLAFDDKINEIILSFKKTHSNFNKYFDEIKPTAVSFTRIRHDYVVIGLNDGSLIFSKIQSDSTPIIRTALNESITAIIQNSFNTYCIALGKNGSACIFRDIYTITPIETPPLPIVCIYFVKPLQFFIFGFEDNLYCYYSMEKFELVEIRFSLPNDALLLWPNIINVNDISKDYNGSQDLFQLKQVNFNGFSFQYNMIDISKLNNLKIDKTEMDLISKKCDSLLQSFQNDKINHFSYVIMGHKSLPTFFYTPYKITFNTLNACSKSTIADILINYQIISNIAGSSQSVDALSKFMNESKFNRKKAYSYFIQKLYHSHNRVTRLAALDFCKKLFFLIHFKNIELKFHLENPDEFLTLNSLKKIKIISFLISNLTGSTISPVFIHPILDIANKKSRIKSSHKLTIENDPNGNDELSCFLFYLLYLGILSDKIKVDVNIFKELIKLYLLKNTSNQFFKEISDIGIKYNYNDVSMKEKDNSNIFLSSFRELCNEYKNNVEFVQKLVNFYLYVSNLSHGLYFGSYIVEDIYRSFLLLGNNSPISDIIKQAIIKYQNENPSVLVYNELFIFGLPNGTLVIYKKSKQIFKDSIFTIDNPNNSKQLIDYVGIGPSNNCCVIISSLHKKAKLFKMKLLEKNVRKAKKAISFLNEFDVEQLGKNEKYTIVWSGENQCEVNILPK